ncbi:MAG: hypothetical protein PHY16_19080 [Methylobacter sp.]|nr:hypothetical protein [Methylobacter sp.]
MHIEIEDQHNNILVLSTETNACEFDVVSCSSNDGGFRPIRGLVAHEFPFTAIHAACKEVERIQQACILPTEASPDGKIVLVTPIIRSTGNTGRAAAQRIMIDLFHASQAPGVEARSLLITQFCLSETYRHEHFAGIFDAINDIRQDTFGNLRLITFALYEVEYSDR